MMIKIIKENKGLPVCLSILGKKKGDKPINLSLENYLEFFFSNECLILKKTDGTFIGFRDQIPLDQKEVFKLKNNKSLFFHKKSEGYWTKKNENYNFGDLRDICYITQRKQNICIIKNNPNLLVYNINKKEFSSQHFTELDHLYTKDINLWLDAICEKRGI